MNYILYLSLIFPALLSTWYRMMRLTGKQNQLCRAFCIIPMEDLTIKGSVIVYSVTFLKGLLHFGLIKQFSDSELTIEELLKKHKSFSSSRGYFESPLSHCKAQAYTG